MHSVSGASEIESSRQVGETVLYAVWREVLATQFHDFKRQAQERESAAATAMQSMEEVRVDQLKLFFSGDVLEEKFEKTKLAWPKDEQSKKPQIGEKT